MQRVLLLLLSLALASHAQAQPKVVVTRPTLPDEIPYQKVLKQYIASLTEKDFTHGVEGPLKAAAETDVEAQYRNHHQTLMLAPLVGTKRGVPSINAPAKNFLLTSIEHPDGVKIPPVYAESLLSFTNWNYPGNHYYGNRALKLRGFVRATIGMVMLDDQIENHPERGGARTDWYGYQLISFALPYLGFQDVLPEPVKKAYQTGLERMGRRVFAWGPKGEEPNFEVIAPLGLFYVSKAIGDPVFAKEAEAYARMIYTDPRHSHPAGYSIDHKGIDVGYQGMTNFFSSWLALASDWQFAKESVERAQRLRAHLILPEPDGRWIGPSHFNSRTSSDVWSDQWEWGKARDAAAALVTDEAAYLVKMPDAESLKTSGARRAGAYNHQISENPLTGKGGYIKNQDIGNSQWQFRIWASFNFPATINPGYEHYPAGAYAKRAKLEAANSPMLKSPFERGESFHRDFAKAFTVVRQPSYAAIVHSGPVGYQGLEDGLHQFHGPLGFGGGQLSTFWTPDAGALIVGRRGGNSWDKTFDIPEEWRTWPHHAVIGCVPDGKFFTSARITQPEVESDVKPEGSTIKVGGIIPIAPMGQGRVLHGRIRYDRQFELTKNQVQVTTTLKVPGQDSISELYEAIPVYLHESRVAPKDPTATTVIAFQVKGQWQTGGTDFVEGVTAIKLSRFKGAATITFETPQRVKLAQTVWTDKYLTAAKCHNVLIDLLDRSPQVVRGEKMIRYRIGS